MNFFGSNGARLSLGLGGQEPPRFRVDRSLLSLICSLHKSPCLEPAPTDRSLNRAPTEARVRTANVVESQKIEPAEQGGGENRKEKSPIEKNLPKQLHRGCPPPPLFQPHGGQNRHPPRLRRAPAIYSVAPLSQLRCALEAVT